MSDVKPPAEKPADVSTIEDPPKTMWGILRRIGPGLIVAGSIVGSGELIATTATGAQAGFWLLWLILIGCVIKVFVQVELGRFTITHGETTLAGFNQVPGPRTVYGNWLLLFWLLTFLASLGQLGGIVGGVGQALAISVPLTDAGRAYNEQVDAETKYRVAEKELAQLDAKVAAGESVDVTRTRQLLGDLQRLGPRVVNTRIAVAKQQMETARRSSDDARFQQLAELTQIVQQRVEKHGNSPEKVFHTKIHEIANPPADLVAAFSVYGKRSAHDDKVWAALITVFTAVMLVVGRYRFIQSFSVFMVSSFTAITLINLVMLQTNQAFSVSLENIVQGMSFRLPPKNELLQVVPLATALATFGIIGVGANELIAYPYWCKEKGYARFTGPRDESGEWAERARGWLRVMRCDAWCSMIVYTFATLAFYLLGAAVLGRIQLNPEGSEMIRTLSVMYEPVFGAATQILFLYGAIAVLYSTFFVATASHARVFPDALRVCRIGRCDESNYRSWVRAFSGIFPFICLAIYVLIPQPAALVFLGATMQALLLPMIALAALYFRYKRSDARITPGVVWDAFLWISAIGMLVAGGWLALTKLFPALQHVA